MSDLCLFCLGGLFGAAIYTAIDHAGALFPNRISGTADEQPHPDSEQTQL